MSDNTSNPWNILPIKNAKSARNCTEVHLSNQGIEKIRNFESFPNLEVVWLNENKVKFI
jgi:Leucine Rich repeats (2 copies)